MIDFEIYNFEKTGKAAAGFNKIDNIFNNIYLSLFIEKGSWFFNPDFGSNLHLLKNAKNSENTRLLAIEYLREATDWIIQIGRATKIETQAERDFVNINTLKFKLRAFQADGLVVEFFLFIPVA